MWFRKELSSLAEVSLYKKFFSGHSALKEDVLVTQLSGNNRNLSLKNFEGYDKLLFGERYITVLFLSTEVALASLSPDQRNSRKDLLPIAV